MMDASLQSRRRTTIPALVAALGVACAFAAAPPNVVNDQGMLRDQNDKPLTGTYDMVFRFMDAATAGNEIMTDQHALSSGNPVTVTGGLFNVQLGSGIVADGSGPGACFAAGLTAETTTDAAAPAPTSGYFYLVTARNRLREEGTKGFRSGGAERVNASPCP